MCWGANNVLVELNITIESFNKIRANKNVHEKKN